MPKRSAFLTLLAALALTSPAAASTTVSHDGMKTQIAGDAEDDVVEIAFTYINTGPVTGNGLLVSNEAGVVPGPGCAPQGTNSVVCPAGDGTVNAQLGEGGDRFGFPEFEEFAVVTNVQGQGGSDTLAGSFSGTLDGGAGDDTLRPIDGDQRVTGGGGTDTVELSGYGGYVSVGGGGEYGTRVDPDVERLRGGFGDDFFLMGPAAGGGHSIEGGAGYDAVSYASVQNPVKVVLGGSGTDDVAADVESASGGSGDDELLGTGATNVLRGGGGNDRLVAGDGSDSLLGGEGNDTLDAGPGDDVLDGAEGNDRLEGSGGEDRVAGGTGGDVLRGGADKDTVSYAPGGYYDGYYYEDYEYQPEPSSGSSSDTPPGVTISLDDRANDGTTSEGDDVGSDIERVFGSEGDDVITGGPGNDEIVGFGGKDRIEGGDGDDKLTGGFGDDFLGGNAGKDELRGGADNDHLDGGPGEDLAIGQDAEGSSSVDGIDLIELRDGERDAAACTAGLSRVLADQHDVVDQKCALIERFTLGPPGSVPPPPPPIGPSPLVRVHLKGTVVDRRGVARVRVSCAPAPVPCAGRLSLYTLRKRKLTRLGGTTFAVPAATTRVIRVKLNKTGRKLVRTRRQVRTQVFVAHQDPKAKPIRIATLGLRRARR